MLLQIAKLGHPILRRIAEPLTEDDIHDPATGRLIDDMIETMRELDGIGLAAPQVFVSRRIQVLEIRANPRYPDAPTLPLLVLINPVVTATTQETLAVWEGCLSVDNLRGLVNRPAAVSVSYLDRHGDPQILDLDGFGAVVMQHETDHLDGKLFLDRMDDMTQLAQIREFERFWLSEPALVTD